MDVMENLRQLIPGVLSASTRFAGTLPVPLIEVISSESIAAAQLVRILRPRMHRALCLEGICRNICACVPDESTLAQLARTCSTFHWPAIEYLWETCSLHDLIKRTVPEDSWTLLEDETIRPTRLLAPTEWQRLLHYSVHVRTLGDNWDQTRIDPHLLWRFSAALPRTSEPFPKVVALFYSRDDGPMEDELLAILSLISSNLRRLRLYCMPESGGTLHSLLSTIAHRFPHLEDLVFLPPRREALSSSMLLIPAGFSNLVKLDIRVTVGESAFEGLATLEKLRELSVYLPASLDWSLKRVPLDAFSELQMIKIRAPTDAAYIHFSHIAPFPCTQQAVIEFQKAPDRSSPIHLPSAIRRQFSIRTLTHLEVYDLYYGQRAGAVVDNLLLSTMSSDHFRPFLRYEKLVRFSYNIGACVYHLDDSILRDMARAWPAMTELSVALHSVRTPIIARPLPSFEVLSDFAFHCPKLTGLAVPFEPNFPIEYSEETLEKIGNSASPLIDLTTCEVYEIEFPQRATEFLTLLFPQLCSINACRVQSPDGHQDNAQHSSGRISSWCEIERYLPIIQSIRRIERRRVERERESRDGGLAGSGSAHGGI